MELTPEIIEIETQSLTIPERATTLRIIDAKTYSRAGNFWKEIRAIRAKVADSFDPLIKHVHAFHKATLAKKEEIDKPLENAERFVKSSMNTWNAEQERIRIAEQRRLEEIARKAEEERLLQEAIVTEAEARASGASKEEAAQEAAAIIEKPVYVPPIIIPKEVPKVTGMSFRTIWKFRIIDIAKIPREYLEPDMVKIGRVVRALKGQTNIPGIRVYEEKV